MAQHEWESPDLSTCKKCGDKDWMADAECSESKVMAELEDTATCEHGFLVGCPTCSRSQ